MDQKSTLSFPGEVQYKDTENVNFIWYKKYDDCFSYPANLMSTLLVEYLRKSLKETAHFTLADICATLGYIGTLFFYF